MDIGILLLFSAFIVFLISIPFLLAEYCRPKAKPDVVLYFCEVHGLIQKGNVVIVVEGSKSCGLCFREKLNDFLQYLDNN